MIKENKWTMRNITDLTRLDDTIEQYKSLGFEVKVEDFDPKKYEAECNECMIESPSSFKVIFTKTGTNADDGLFDD